MKRILTALLMAFLIFQTCSKSTEPAQIDSRFVLTNFTLIDGNGGDPIEDAVVLVDSGIIVAAGPRTTTPLPEQVTVIDLNGATVLPGFINAHIHNGYDRPNLEAWAQGGVTTVRDLGGPTSFALGDQLSADPVCARLVMAGPMLSVPGGYPYVPWGSSSMLPVESVDDAREKVNQLVDNGADIIKLAVESGLEFGMVIPTLSPEEARAIVETAHENGTVASGHVLVAYDMGRALDAGVDDLAHMVVDNVSDQLIQRTVNNGVYWVPTLELWYRVGHSRVDYAIANLRRFVAAGGLVALGTDYDGYDAEFELGMPMLEMAYMLEAGMTPMQIIVAGTKHAAQVCNRGDDLGTVEAGKIADLIVVSGNPLTNLQVLDSPGLVIHNGVVIRDER